MDVDFPEFAGICQRLLIRPSRRVYLDRADTRQHSAFGALWLLSFNHET
jgi:hypothetical protein